MLLLQSLQACCSWRCGTASAPGWACSPSASCARCPQVRPAGGYGLRMTLISQPMALPEELPTGRFAALLRTARAHRAPCVFDCQPPPTPPHLQPLLPAGELPFDVPSDAPPPLADIMRRCISLNPSARPSFNEILQALSELSSGLQSSTPALAPTSAAGSAGVTPINSHSSADGSSRRAGASAARSMGAASPFAPASPFASPPTSAAPSPFGSVAAVAAAAESEPKGQPAAPAGQPAAAASVPPASPFATSQ